MGRETERIALHRQAPSERLRAHFSLVFFLFFVPPSPSPSLLVCLLQSSLLLIGRSGRPNRAPFTAFPGRSRPISYVPAFYKYNQSPANVTASSNSGRKPSSSSHLLGVARAATASEAILFIATGVWSLTWRAVAPPPSVHSASVDDCFFLRGGLSLHSKTTAST